VIKNEQEFETTQFETTLERIAYFQRQVTKLREVEDNPANYRSSVSGYLAELDRMNLAVRDYLWLHPSEFGERSVVV
jgi:hypothetical protein